MKIPLNGRHEIIKYESVSRLYIHPIHTYNIYIYIHVHIYMYIYIYTLVKR